LIFIIAGAVTGNGALHADGERGGSSTGAAGTAGDAAGGGGGGGTVVVSSGAIPTTIAITANGGVGGDHTNSINANEVEGPGGGGGGGYIAVSGGTTSAAGALGGTTTVATSAMASFRTNGATAGHAGLTNGSASGFIYCGTTTAPVTTIATFPPDHSKSATGAFTFTNTEGSVTYQCSLDGGTTWAFCAASYTTPTLADGSHTLWVRSTDLSGNQETPPVTHTWAIDTVPPVTTITGHPTDPSSSTTGSFTFTTSESPAPVTYECKLDTPAGAGIWAACDTGNPSNPAYTAGPLTDGTYKLWVRATDQAGNVEVEPPYVTWTWQVELSLDGGSLDGGSVDSGGEVASPVLVDAEGVDAFVNEDLAVAADDAGPPDIAPDKAPFVVEDTAPLVSVDTGVDAEGVDLLLFLDVGEPRDTKVLDAETAGTGVLSDALPSGAEPGPDTAPPAPEPNPDTAAPVVKEDAAAPLANKDAAPNAEDLKIMGAGFCAIASPHSTSPAPFLVLGLAALALLRRRRNS
jgi:MYXO-CTERM domain-containing protein